MCFKQQNNLPTDAPALVGRSSYLVPLTGLEPVRYCYRGILRSIKCLESGDILKNLPDLNA